MEWTRTLPYIAQAGYRELFLRDKYIAAEDRISGLH